MKLPNGGEPITLSEEDDENYTSDDKTDTHIQLEAMFLYVCVFN